MAATVQALHMFDKLLAKYEFWKFLRITSWILRFLNNCRRTKNSIPLITREIEQRKNDYDKCLIYLLDTFLKAIVTAVSDIVQYLIHNQNQDHYQKTGQKQPCPSK